MLLVFPKKAVAHMAARHEASASGAAKASEVGHERNLQPEPLVWACCSQALATAARNLCVEGLRTKPQGSRRQKVMQPATPLS